ncbi:hypothetical protein QJS04_geneDACA017095 [Acorus gramineus]|uniref:Glycosyltransferase family 92 protein n=1 Tax=Acorus gramineus TaxID=55184 RepID=A0AAV9AWT7_ACOGR|nr:hypothetical protein QJS04_geneDACA017095 [Acorus gramineus]
MAGLYAPIRATSSSSTSTSTSSTSNQGGTFASRLLLLLTVLPLTLAAFAFVLQWRGGLEDPESRWPTNHQSFPGMENSPRSDETQVVASDLVAQSSPSDCAELLGHRSSPAFPYVRGWSFDFESDLRPKGVKVIYRTRELEEKQAKSRIWNETWLSSFFYKPCNYELFVKQSLNMEMAIVMARNAGMDWIIHLDTDELLHPAGAREYSLRQLLLDVPDNVDMESSVEREDIKDPFSEVSMFKKNYDHLPKETYFGMYKEATRGNPNYFLTYGNGKSAARIQDHLRPNGAHRWHNYMKTPNEIKLEEAAVLHYTYTKFSDLTSRRDRCGCKPTKEDVKRCFMLDFDRQAFIIASTAKEDEMLRWFREHIVWTDKSLNLKLVRKGILTRIYAPMAIVQGLRESGLFRNVITNALFPSKNLPPHAGHSNSSSDFNSNDLHVDSKAATARKVLELVNAFEAPAVGPQSPPGLDDVHLMRT